MNMDCLFKTLKNPDDFVSASANYIRGVDMFPLYMIIHYLLVTTAHRSITGSQAYAKAHPLSSWAVSLLACFGGSIITQFVLGFSVLEPFQHEKFVAVASLVWYLVFFSPFDVVHKLLEYKISKVILVSLKEIHRLRMIMNGVRAGIEYYPGVIGIPIFLGCIKGSGAKFLLRPLHQFMRGEVICLSELQRPQFSTKVSLVTSVLLTIMKTNQIAFCEEDTLLVGYVGIVVAFQVSFVLLDVENPFAKVEKIICYILFELPQELVRNSNKPKTE